MKRSQQQEVERIVYLWLGFVDKNDKHECIALSGPSVMGKFFDYEGQLPDSSGIKPETLGSKVDKQMCIEISDEEKKAHKIIMDLPIDLRCCIALWPQIKRKVNEGTHKLFQEKDVIGELEKIGLHLTFEEYIYKKEVGGEMLLILAKHNGLLYENIREAMI